MTKRKTKADREVVTPTHGRGKLIRGGNWGNKGGGRLPSALREALRGSASRRVKILERIADDPNARDCDRIKACEALLKYGLGTVSEVAGKLGIEGQHLIGHFMAPGLDLPRLREEIKAKLARMHEAINAPEPVREPAKLDPAKRVPDEEPPKRQYDPDQVIAVFEDRPPPQPREVEIHEPVVEKSTPAKRSSASSGSFWGNGPGRAFIRVGYD